VVERKVMQEREYRVSGFDDGFCFVVVKIVFYLFERESERPQEGVGSEGEAGSLLSREPDAGLDPGSPGS